MATRAKLIELARLGRTMPGGPSGELHERERTLAELGIRVWWRLAASICSLEGVAACATGAPDRPDRASWFGWKLVDGHWDW